LAAASDTLSFRVFNGATSSRDFRFRYGAVMYQGWAG
jgi:hypothetical protein